MKRPLWVLGIPLLLLTLVTCAQQISHLLKQQEARAGLDTLITQLPELADFDAVKIVRFEFSDTAYGKTCYYARSYVILGSSLSEAEALTIYARRLQTLGWVPRDEPYDTSVLYGGLSALAIVTSGEPGADIKDALDYNQLRRIYRSVIFVRLDYMLPSRKEC